jgi:hypothetical protein
MSWRADAAIQSHPADLSKGTCASGRGCFAKREAQEAAGADFDPRYITPKADHGEPLTSSRRESR